MQLGLLWQEGDSVGSNRRTVPVTTRFLGDFVERISCYAHHIVL